MTADERSTVEALASRVRIGRFVSVGVVGGTVELAIMTALIALFAFHPLAAKAVGTEASISLMFFINDRWTFAGEGAASERVVRWLRSHAVRVVGIAVSFLVLFLLTSYTEITLIVLGENLWPTVANGLGIGAGMVLNYLAESLFTWRVTE